MSIPFPKLTDSIKCLLQTKFQDRVSFDPVECLLYSHDLGSPPPLIKPLISRHMAEGVVQPCNEQEVADLLRLASEYKIPLTPRGRGTSGYGGTIPRYGGLVVDFTRMDKILYIDPSNLTATVQPGVIWLNLERELANRGLALRLYPGSAPSSTVAGWLAQGGSGFGSYAYGWFGENIVSVRIVLPDGNAVACTADELDIVKNAEGITGFITEITLKVKLLEAMETLTVSFETAAHLSGMLKTVAEQRLKLWSVSFINPYMASLKRRLRQQAEGSPPVGNDAYLATFVFCCSYPIHRVHSSCPINRATTIDEIGVRDTLENLAYLYHGRVLSQEFSDMLWNERFEILKLKKLAPSLISTKVAVPLASMEAAIENSRKLGQPLATEGVILQDKNMTSMAVLLGFILHDERKASYNLIYSLALSFVKLAGKLGGRPCAAGIYFKRQAAEIIGPDRLSRIIQRKHTIDPQNILNPGKIISPSSCLLPKGERIRVREPLDALMGLAWKFEPGIRFMANRIRPCGSPIYRGTTEANNWYAYCCDQCGFCLAGCPQFQGWESHSPKGRWYLLRLFMQGRLKLEDINRVLQSCGSCHKCPIICPQGLPMATYADFNPINLELHKTQGII